MEGTREFPLRRGPIPVEVHLDECQRGVRLRQALIERERLDRRRPRSRHRLATRQLDIGHGAQQGIRVRQARIRRGVLGVPGNGLLEVLDGSPVAPLRSLVPEVPTLRVELVRPGVDRTGAGHPRLLLGRQREIDLPGDRLRHVAL